MSSLLIQGWTGRDLASAVEGMLGGIREQLEKIMIKVSDDSESVSILPYSATIEIIRKELESNGDWLRKEAEEIA